MIRKPLPRPSRLYRLRQNLRNNPAAIVWYGVIAPLTGVFGYVAIVGIFGL